MTYTNIGDTIYVEADPRHYAMYGQVKDKDGIRIVTVNRETHHYLISKCFIKKEELDAVDKDYLRDYVRVREVNIDVNQVSLAISNIPARDYTWFQIFS